MGPSHRLSHNVDETFKDGCTRSRAPKIFEEAPWTVDLGPQLGPGAPAENWALIGLPILRKSSVGCRRPRMYTKNIDMTILHRQVRGLLGGLFEPRGSAAPVTPRWLQPWAIGSWPSLEKLQSFSVGTT